MSKLLSLIVLLILTGVTAQSQTSDSNKAQPLSSPKTTESRGELQPLLQGLEPEIASRGEMVSVSGEFPKFPVDAVVELRALSSTSQPSAVRTDGVTIREDGSSLSFTVPRNIRLGKYEVVVTFSKSGRRFQPIVVPIAEGGSFSVVTGEPIKIEAVYPVVNYPEAGNFGFKIIGEGFGPLLSDNRLEIVGEDVLTQCDGSGATDCIKETIDESGRVISFSGLAPDKYYGVKNVRLRVGDQTSQAIAVTLSRVGRSVPALISVAVLLLIVGLIAFSLWGKRWSTTAGRSTSLLKALFLDKETNTYSLSKLQFYVWTAAAVFGYVYLSVSRSLVQGNLEFSDIPENLPGILLVAVSTSALAVGITSAKGSKGAGDPGPSLADFVTTGGVVAAERLQFLVWTIIGVGAFIFLTLSTEPGKIQNLPAVPERFLYLMGISSFGYLGGKLARKPGPVITQIEAETGSLILQIHGSSLSPDGTFKVDDIDLNPKRLDNKHHPDGRPEIVTKDETPAYAKVLRLVIALPEEDWLAGEHNFTITNPDGQKAVLTFATDEETEL
jgi:hypothetical protein